MNNRPNKKMLILGGSGLLGSAARNFFKDKYIIFSPDSSLCDVLDPNVMEKWRNYRADVIIYAVAHELQAITDAELLRAFHINIRVPLFLLELLANENSRLFLFSTDMVFPGGEFRYYTEEDTPVASSPHGWMKIGTETILRQASAQTYIIRLSRIFGPTQSSRKNVVNGLIKLWLSGKDLELVADVFKSYTYSHDVAEMIDYILKQELPCGIYHIANSGKASMYDFFLEMGEHTHEKGRIKPVLCDTMNLKKRPKTSLLSSVHLPIMRSWQDGVRDFCHNYLKNTQ